MSSAPVLQRLGAVRAALRQRGLAACIVTLSDPHLSEYPAEHWKTLRWLCGFTGSVGTLVISESRAALCVDGRYQSQASRQLEGTGIEVFEIPVGHANGPADWLAALQRPHGMVAVDGRTVSSAVADLWAQRLSAAGLQLRTDLDLVSALWGAQRPRLPARPVFCHDAHWIGLTARSKLRLVRDRMAGQGATHHVVSTLDDVAWITNLRGSDVNHNPVFLAHLMIGATGAVLFVERFRLEPAACIALAEAGIDIAPYDALETALGRLDAASTMLLDPKRVTEGLRAAVPAAVKVVAGTNPSTLLKARKAAPEIEHIREAMAQDAVAMCEFYAWFEAATARGERVTEVLVHERLAEERSKRAGYYGLSFHTVAAFKAHGAMPHYQATCESDALIAGNGLLLIDSGGQYLGGTTDITRVWPIGEVTDAQRRDYTLVLKGMIALTRARFPRGTLSPMIDAIARAPLWAEGLDYPHGTGHGVGYFLNVHEGPQTLSRVQTDASMALEPGMITSIEPGVYRPGQWGVRIENLVLTRPVATLENDSFGEMLEFETLTLCPIDASCILRGLMRDDEIDWLNGYHRTVQQRVLPLLEGRAAEWLRARTQPL